MKTIRQNKILEIITNKAIGTQEELAEELRRQGLEVTQATVSRDIRELRLFKNLTSTGSPRYAVPQDSVHNQGDRMTRMFRDSVLRLDESLNLLVIKTLPGTAQAVASTIDDAGWPDILGTVAGDDTILVVIKGLEKVGEIKARMSQMIL